MNKYNFLNIFYLSKKKKKKKKKKKEKSFIYKGNIKFYVLL